MKMIYIHQLKDLSTKTADIECTPLIREIKKGHSIPLREEEVSRQLIIDYVSKIDIEYMTKTQSLIPEAIDEIVELSEMGKDLEKINLKRAIEGLKEITEPMEKNTEYAKKLIEHQEQFAAKLTLLLNTIPELKTDQEKKDFDEKITAVFSRLLRNKKDFSFAYSDIINEEHTSRLHNMMESMNEGVFFHVKLEEHLNKEEGKDVVRRIPAAELDKVNSITKKITLIKEGVDRAYETNMRMVNMAVVIYAYIKWLNKSA